MPTNPQTATSWRQLFAQLTLKHLEATPFRWLAESQRLITDVRGWVATGHSETAILAIDDYWRKWRNELNDMLPSKHDGP